MEFRKITIEEFEKLKRLFPDNEDMWIKYKKKRLEQFEKKEIDVFVIEEDEKVIGEITVSYKNDELKTETIPNKRVYLQAFRVDKKYQEQGLGQKKISRTRFGTKVNKVLYRLFDQYRLYGIYNRHRRR